jgi:hypothetical protein
MEGQMYGSFVLFDESNKIETGERIYLNELGGMKEAWLRDRLFDYPEIIPVGDIESSFGPLVPLCKELRTDAGPIDAVFINERGQLTIVEYKLWKNPEARREVVAQTVDYAKELTRWSYADLQRQVAASVRRQGNIPFELVQKRAGGRVREQEFVDAVSRSLQEGRFLVLLIGDGIREGAQSLAEFWNRSQTKAFSFGLIEVAVYRFKRNRFAIQPRILARTETITRQMTIVNMRGGADSVIFEDMDDDEPDRSTNKVQARNKEHLRAWWQPVLNMKFDDPEQEPPFWVATNNAVLSTPFPGIRIKALAIVGGSQVGVFVSGRRTEAIRPFLKRERRDLLDKLPKGTEFKVGDKWPITLYDNRESDDDKRAWIKERLNDFANVLRPRLRKWYEEANEEGLPAGGKRATEVLSHD